MEFIIQDALKSAEQNQQVDIEVGKANIKVIGVGGAGNNMVS